MKLSLTLLLARRARLLDHAFRLSGKGRTEAAHRAWETAERTDRVVDRERAKDGGSRRGMET